MKRILIAAVMMFLFQLTVSADAAEIRVDRVGTSNVYSVNAYDLPDVGGVEIEIQYDRATLSNPRITQGAKLASMSFFPNVDCSEKAVAARICTGIHNIKIAAMSLSSIKGSGVLATITFDLIGAAPGPVSVARSKMSAPTGAVVKHDTPPPSPPADSSPASTDIMTASASSQPSGVPSGVSSGISSGVVSGGSSIGSISLPTDQLAASSADRKTDYQPMVTDLRKDMTLPLGGSEGRQASAGDQLSVPVKGQEKSDIAYKSTLQLFREFKGEKSATSLIALFAEVLVPGFIQEPPIAFSDGKTPLKITIVIRQTGSEAPKFLLHGANVKKLSGVGEDLITWTIEALPKKDATEAKLTIIDGQSTIEIPLTIAPKINPQLTKGKALSEADFAAYLAKPQKFDLNNDKKFDALDDFIYAANYIVAMKIKPEKLKKEEKKEPAKPELKDDAKTKEPVKVKDKKDKNSEKPAVKP